MTETMMEALHGFPMLINTMSVDLTGKHTTATLKFRVEVCGDNKFESVDSKMKDVVLMMQKSIESVMKDVERMRDDVELHQK